MIFEMFVSFVAVLAFAVIFDVSKSELIFCGISGLVSEGIYLMIMRVNNEEAFAVLLAALITTSLARILANIRKVPVTVYLICAIIPLVPGAGMYKTVYGIIASDYHRAALAGIDTIKTATEIAVGIFLVFALPNKIFLKK